MEDMASQIMLVGAGQLGSRYLQGLCSVTEPISVKVVDTNESAFVSAKTRLAELDSHPKCEISWSIDLASCPTQLDLVIVSTLSRNRMMVIEEISSRASVKYWVLEKVLVQSSEDARNITQVISGSRQAWVNTPRRAMLWHRDLKDQLFGSSPLKVVKSGALWGLACNSIHFIDLVAWWTGESLVAIDARGLSQDWFESKRPGFYEVTGYLIATYSGGSVLTLRSDPEAQDDQLTVETRKGVVWLIDEAKGVAISREGTEVLGHLEFQSALTPRLVTGILEHGSCELPTLEESAQMHCIFLDAMLKHWNDSRGLNDTHVPIT
jgi:hypothetical protein